jgi:hypothetical protein
MKSIAVSANDSTIEAANAGGQTASRQHLLFECSGNELLGANLLDR